MKVLVACNYVENFLLEHNADALTMEAFKALAAYAKGVDTKTAKSRPSYREKSPHFKPAPTANAEPARSGPASGTPWTTDEESKLRSEFLSGISAPVMAQNHNRTIEAIAARLVKLRCINAREELAGYNEYRDAIRATYKK